MDMNLSTILSIVSICVGLVALASVLIRVGQERQARVDLERRHDELAKEFREKAHLREKLADKVTELEKLDVARASQLENLNHRLREKASVESVEALRQSLGRIEGTITEMARRLDELMQILGKNHP